MTKNKTYKDCNIAVKELKEKEKALEELHDDLLKIYLMNPILEKQLSEAEKSYNGYRLRRLNDLIDKNRKLLDVLEDLKLKYIQK